MNQFLSKSIVFLSLGVSALSFSAAIHDSYESKPIRFGFEGGLTFSEITTPSDVKPSNRTGFAAGVNVDIPLGSVFSFQPEAIFVQKSYELAKAGNLSWTAKYNSLDIPVQLKATFGGKISPFIMAGPVATLNLSRSVEASSGGSTSSLGFNPKTFDFGVGVAAGVNFDPVFVVARYNLGLVDVDDNSAQWKSRGFQLLAGLRL